MRLVGWLLFIVCAVVGFDLWLILTCVLASGFGFVPLLFSGFVAVRCWFAD